MKKLQANNYQIRYILAGVDTQPTNIANSRYVFISKSPPKVGQWVHFERNIRQDFSGLWGSLPTGFTSIRVCFETRWDERAASDGPSAADVYYDDLYWGPAAGALRPSEPTPGPPPAREGNSWTPLATPSRRRGWSRRRALPAR